MIGRQLGPYAVESELGSGGMGTVYRATGPDGVVALKVLHPHLLATPGFFKRFLREAEIGKAIRHANVVRTLDVDAQLVDDRQVNYMVLEYVEGKSLRQLLRALGTVPETLLREIALQTAAGLAAIHAAGIVHRDLKPENLLITDDHEIRIMDLGVARLQEATIDLTREGQFSGSLLYAAPEQFRDDVEVGPASDLYSLGVLLYELATGENPFRRFDASQVIDAHLHFEPRRIHDVNTATTRFLSELVACLLAKEPRKRFGSAKALQDIVEEAERSPWWKTIAPTLDRKPRPKIRVRRDTRLHGRAADLKLLRRAWERARVGEGNTVWLDGEAGIGKTRLLAEFLDSVDSDAHVLYGSYPPSGGLGGFSDAILDHFGDVDLEERLEPYLAVTPLLVPAFAALVKHDAPPEGAEPIQGDALNAVGVHLMRGLAAERATLWIVDDLHFAPRESRYLALSLSRAAEGHPVLLVYTARPGVPEEELAHFERLEGFQRVTLARLGGREIVELLEDAFRSEALADRLGAKIAHKSDGVPLFVFEMVRGLIERQFLRQEPDGSYTQTRVIDDIEVPSAVKDLIQGRLRGLTREERAILDVAAVLGTTFDPALVCRVLEEKRVRILRHLAEIERRHGLVHDAGNVFAFDQNQVQEVLYGNLPAQLRAEYHTLLAQAHAARLEGDPGEEDAVFLCSHHLRGSRPDEGLPHLDPALEHLERSYRNEAVIELAARALGLPGLLAGETRVRTLLKKAGRHGLLGETGPERSALNEALRLADAIADVALRAAVQVSLSASFLRTADPAAARECLEQALDLAREARDRKLECLAMGNLGGVCYTQGDYGQARACIEEHLALARELADENAEAASRINLALILMGEGRSREAAKDLEKGLVLARRCGNLRWQANATLILGTVYYLQGDYARAGAQYGKALVLAREIGDRECETSATGNVGIVLFGQGDYAQAGAHFEKQLALARETGDRTGEVNATRDIGNVSWAQGDFVQARAHFERCLALACELGDRANEALVRGNLGEWFLGQGEHREARAQLTRSLAMAREIGNRRQEGYALHGFASLTDAEGDRDGARRLFGESLAIRRELGERGTVAETLVGLGCVEGKQGDHGSAVARLDEALATAREVQHPGTILLAAVHGARLRGGDRKAALAALREYGNRVPHGTKLEVRYHLWDLTLDRTHLTEAKRLLDFAVQHSPEEYRASMRENVPLHRDITRAWEEHGGEA